MGKEEQMKAKGALDRDRRSSIRVRSQLPCSVEALEEDALAALEARILDVAVMESEGVMHDAVDWRDHAEDLSPEMVYVLNELRALRQQLSEVQRIIERHNERDLKMRWVELNNQGLWLPDDETDESWELGDYASIRIQIPSIQTPEILAVGRVIRVDKEEGREGAAFEFCSISHPHKQAISRYALRRERQMARSVRLDLNFD